MSARGATPPQRWRLSSCQVLTGASLLASRAMCDLAELQDERASLVHSFAQHLLGLSCKYCRGLGVTSGVRIGELVLHIVVHVGNGLAECVADTARPGLKPLSSRGRA